jgi:hypothetical protein
MRRILCLLVLSSVIPSTLVLAQERPRTGIVMGYPASFGLLWHANDRVAIRPEVAFTRTSTGGENSQAILGSSTLMETSTSFWSTSAGVSGLFYMTPADALQTYVSPRFLYGRTNSHSSTAGTAGDVTVTGSTYFASGSFGAEYLLGRRFAVFGEIGVGLTRTNLTSDVGSIHEDSHSTSIATRSGVGVVFYLNR